MEVEFLDRLSEPVRDGKAKSVSEIIRTALERYDFSDVLVMHPAQLLVSVRLPTEIRRQLKKTARSKHTSVGHLVRAAVEAYLPEVEAMPAPEAGPSAGKSGKRRKKKRAKGGRR
jgi:predicted DNA-binding protein